MDGSAWIALGVAAAGGGWFLVKQAIGLFRAGRATGVHDASVKGAVDRLAASFEAFKDDIGGRLRSIDAAIRAADERFHTHETSCAEDRGAMVANYAAMKETMGAQARSLENLNAQMARIAPEIGTRRIHELPASRRAGDGG